MGRQFEGREIVKTTLGLGIAGQIELDGKVLPPPMSLVSFQARARLSSIKHKFREDGQVEEIRVLTVDPDTFAVLSIEPAPEQARLPLEEPEPAEE